MGPGPGKFLFSKTGLGNETMSPGSFCILESSENISKMTPPDNFYGIFVDKFLKKIQILLPIFF